MLDLLIVITTLALGLGALALLYAWAKTHRRSSRINCVSNLKQLGTAIRMFANDNDGKYPGFNATNEAWNYFQATGDQISSPKVLLCPADTGVVRTAMDFDTNHALTSFEAPANRNHTLSYFYGVDADDTKPNMLLSGDRNLTTNSMFLRGLLTLNTNVQWSWAKGMHNGFGNLGFADGSVGQVTPDRLQTRILSYTNRTQRIILP